MTAPRKPQTTVIAAANDNGRKARRQPSAATLAIVTNWPLALPILTEELILIESSLAKLLAEVVANDNEE